MSYDDLSRSITDVSTYAKILSALQSQNPAIEDDTIHEWFTKSPQTDIHDVTVSIGEDDVSKSETFEGITETPYFLRIPQSPYPYDLVHSTLGNGLSFPFEGRKYGGKVTNDGTTHIKVNHQSPRVDVGTSSFAIAFWLSYSDPGSYGIISKKSISNIIDTFDSDLAAWTAWGSNGYSPTHDAVEHGGSAKVSGNGFTVDSGMQKEFNVSDIGNMLSFDYRAKSGFASSSVTNIRLKILDSENSDAELYSEAIVAGGTLDTGWKNYSKNISSIVQGKARIKVVIYLNDSWSVNYNQMFWIDNFSLLLPQNSVGFDVWVDDTTINAQITDGMNSVLLSGTLAALDDGNFHSVIINVPSSGNLELFIDNVSKATIPRGSVGSLDNTADVIIFGRRNSNGAIQDKLNGSLSWLVWKKGEIFNAQQRADYHSDQILDLTSSPDTEVITLPFTGDENPQPNIAFAKCVPS